MTISAKCCRAVHGACVAWQSSRVDETPGGFLCHAKARRRESVGADLCVRPYFSHAKARRREFVEADLCVRPLHGGLSCRCAAIHAAGCFFRYCRSFPQSGIRWHSSAIDSHRRQSIAIDGYRRYAPVRDRAWRRCFIQRLARVVRRRRRRYRAPCRSRRPGSGCCRWWWRWHCRRRR